MIGAASRLPPTPWLGQGERTPLHVPAASTCPRELFFVVSRKAVESVARSMFCAPRMTGTTSPPFSSDVPTHEVDVVKLLQKRVMPLAVDFRKYLDGLNGSTQNVGRHRKALRRRLKSVFGAARSASTLWRSASKTDVTWRRGLYALQPCAWRCSCAWACVVPCDPALRFRVPKAVLPAPEAAPLVAAALCFKCVPMSCGVRRPPRLVFAITVGSRPSSASIFLTPGE